MTMFFLLLLFSISFVNCNDISTNELDVQVTDQPGRCQMKARNGDLIVIHYNATLLGGSKVDSSLDRGVTFNIILGAGQVIKGLEQGLIGMCPKEKRQLTIPPHLAYGEKGVGNVIPSDATLVYDVQLLQINHSPPPNNNLFKFMDVDSDNQISADEMVDYFLLELWRMEEDGNVLGYSIVEQRREMITSMFKQKDKDVDGFISFDEFEGPKVDQEFVIDRNNLIVLSPNVEGTKNELRDEL